MEFSSNMNFSWGKDAPTRDHAEIDLDLNLSNIFKGRDIASELMHGREQVRKEIFDIVIGIVKKAVTDQGEAIQIPDGTKTETHARTRAQHEFREGVSGLAINNRMKIIANMNSNNSLSPLSATYSARGVIADSITNTIMQGLADRYLGESSARTQTRFQDV